MNLEDMQWVADEHADRAAAAILGDGPAQQRFARVDALNEIIRTWQTNHGVASWRPTARSTALGLDQALLDYVQAATPLPAWADPARIGRAERLFMDYGALSVTMLFCASLPECYVVPDLAAVLHATGQLEDRAEHRIRTTGAMIFPVMMRGGLTQPDGYGIAQVLKVRLIHATIRNLILRGSPEAALLRMRSANDAGSAYIPPLASVAAKDGFSRALHVHGWDLAACGLPNNQEELAYTLLTFSYVYLRALRRLGIPVSPGDERDYMHAWNVAGHFLGIRRELMVETMEEAEALFAKMQARGREQWAARPLPWDPRPSLAAALMDAMQSVIPDGPLKSFPVLLTRRLMEKESIRDLGLDGRVSRSARFWFAFLMATVRGIDAVARRMFRDFSIARLITRVMGYRLTCALLMSQTRELAVPSTLRPDIHALIGRWGEDPKASSRMNAIEDRFTTQGAWEALESPAGR